jgi:hypothetical protein
MIEVLEFVFSSFWTWLGSVILVSAITAGFTAGWRAIFTVTSR